MQVKDGTRKPVNTTSYNKHAYNHDKDIDTHEIIFHLCDYVKTLVTRGQFDDKAIKSLELLKVIIRG